MSPRQAAYRSFLKTDFWKSLAAEKKRLFGKCEECGSTTHLQAHHLTYPNDWYDTTLDHLQVLCRRHHKAAHGLECGPPSNILLFREDDRFSRFLHWCQYLYMRVCGRGVRLKDRERRYLDAALKAYPDTASDKAMSYRVSLVLTA